MKNSIRLCSAAGALAAVVAFGAPARAASVTYSGSSTNPATGQALSAKAVFTYDAGGLTVDLDNTGAPAKAPSDVLTCVFFKLSGSTSAAPVSAALGSGAVLLNGPGSYSLGQEWQYLGGISGPAGSNSGIGSAGLGIFSSGNFAPNGTQVQGFTYEIVNGISPDANGPTQSAIFASPSMEFALAPSADFQLADVTNVTFQYGTALSEPEVTGTPTTNGDQPSDVPEPGTEAYVVCGVLTASGWAARYDRRRRFRCRYRRA